MLSNITYIDGGTVTFGDNSKGYVIGIREVINSGISNSPVITNALLVENLKHNLLSISQLCDKGFQINFEKDRCDVFDNNKQHIFEGFRNKNIYVLNMNINKNSNLCLTVKHDDPWLWHKRFCHINFKNINKLAKYEFVGGLP